MHEPRNDAREPAPIGDEPPAAEALLLVLKALLLAAVAIAIGVSLSQIVMSTPLVAPAASSARR